MPDRLRASCAFLSISLLAAPSSAFAQSADASAKPPERMICKKVSETGSLVKKTKVCLTRDQWNRAAARGQEYGREMQEGLRGKPNGA